MDQNVFQLLHLVCWLIIIPWHFYSCIEFVMDEETEAGSTIDQISSQQYKTYSFSLEHKYFSITNDGSIKVRRKIDLDTICDTDTYCCGVEQCWISFQVIYRTTANEGEQSMDIRVKVMDKDDNFPKFEKKIQNLRISELVKVGMKISLIPANDIDFSEKNRHIKYKLHDSSNTFNLDSSQLGSPVLIIMKSLDYEKKRRYQVEWNACDATNNCDSQILNITIRDENDNSPKFLKPRLKLKIPENFSTSRVITRFNATDLDDPPYNKIEYGIWRSRKIRHVSNMFKVSKTTGTLRLRQELKAHIQSKYMFKVYAADMNAPNTEKDFLQVEIVVEDVNDHNPVIELINSGQEIMVEENRPPGHIVSLRVSDKDTGENGNTSCSIKPHDNNNRDFILSRRNKKLYSLSSLRSFNREQQRQINVVVTCRDHGSPSLSSFKTVMIRVTDVNEFQPKFKHALYNISIIEEQPLNQYLLTIEATDNDTDHIFNYTIDYNGPFFIMEPKSGVLRIGTRKIDREKNSEFKFAVRVTDSNRPGQTQFTNSASIIVRIEDINDNAPMFFNTSDTFHILEESSKAACRETVLAIDKDVDIMNSQVQYSIDKIVNHRGQELVHSNLFTISNLGKITTSGHIDREKSPFFTLTVRASDTGTPPQSTVKKIRVVVQDINDHAPHWINPIKHTNRPTQLNISWNDADLGYTLLHLKALDNDIGNNGKVRYHVRLAPPGFISVNATTGITIFESRPQQQFYELKFIAEDLGQPTKSTEIFIHLNIDGTYNSALNSTIIIIMLVVTGIISLFLIIAITCVRRRPNFVPSFESCSQLDTAKSGVPTTHFSPVTVKGDGYHGNRIEISNQLYYPPSNNSYDIIQMTKPHSEGFDIDSANEMLNSNIYMSQNICSGGSGSSFTPSSSALYNTLPLQMGPVVMSSASVNAQATGHTYSKFTSLHPFPPNSFRHMTHGPVEGREDDDSADSGRGASEDDVGLAQQQLQQHPYSHLGPDVLHGGGSSTLTSAISSTSPLLMSTFNRNLHNHNNATLVTGSRSYNSRGYHGHNYHTLQASATSPFYIVPEHEIALSNEASTFSNGYHDDSGVPATSTITTTTSTFDPVVKSYACLENNKLPSLQITDSTD